MNRLFQKMESTTTIEEMSEDGTHPYTKVFMTVIDHPFYRTCNGRMGLGPSVLKLETSYVFSNLPKQYSLFDTSPKVMLLHLLAMHTFMERCTWIRPLLKRVV